MGWVFFSHRPRQASEQQPTAPRMSKLTFSLLQSFTTEGKARSGHTAKIYSVYLPALEGLMFDITEGLEKKIPPHLTKFVVPHPASIAIQKSLIRRPTHYVQRVKTVLSEFS